MLRVDVAVGPEMPANIVRRTTKKGDPRFIVRFREGRDGKMVHLGSFRTLEEAELRKRRIDLAVAQGRLPDPDEFRIRRRRKKPPGRSLRSNALISPRLRFSVLERDGFTCQYCGRGAPDVELQADHVFPVSLGGVTNLENLVTACIECNVGKAATLTRRARAARAALDEKEAGL